MFVLALVLTVLQASPSLPGIEYLLRGLDPLYASIFSMQAFRLIAHSLCSHLRQLALPQKIMALVQISRM